MRYQVFPVEGYQVDISMNLNYMLNLSIFVLSLVSLIIIVNHMVNLNEVYEKVYTKYSVTPEPESQNSSSEI